MTHLQFPNVDVLVVVCCYDHLFKSTWRDVIWETLSGVLPCCWRTLTSHQLNAVTLWKCMLEAYIQAKISGKEKAPPLIITNSSNEIRLRTFGELTSKQSQYWGPTEVRFCLYCQTRLVGAWGVTRIRIVIIHIEILALFWESSIYMYILNRNRKR